MTYTYAILDVSPECYREIRRLLVAAGHQHRFDGHMPEQIGKPVEEVIDMQGIALREQPLAPVVVEIDPADIARVYEHGTCAHPEDCPCCKQASKQADHGAYHRLASAVNRAVGQLADDVARDLDHDNRAHPKWWRAVQEERKALLALDAKAGPCLVCGLPWSQHGGRDGR